MLLDEFGQTATNATCYWCALDIHEECILPAEAVGHAWFKCCCTARMDEAANEAQLIPGNRGGQVKALDQVSDLTSTGRKRAAMLYPIFPGMVCEWSGLLRAGGGPDPITGCNGNLIFPTKDGTAGNVHHGPDKSTLNNHPSNVHRICWSCHQTWHSQNNRYYGKRPSGDQPFLPLSEYSSHSHEPDTWATEAVLVAVSAGRASVNPRVEDPTRRGVIPEDERRAT